MCLAACAIGLNARFPFVLLANRDERFDRAAEPMAWWSGEAGAPAVLAGRDLAAGGTWLGLTAAGRLALVTNVREPGRELPLSPSRGALVPQWLRGAQNPLDSGALDHLGSAPRNGFNLLVADLSVRAEAGDEAVTARWMSNRPQLQQRALGRGLHAVSNAALDTPWPKLLKLKHDLQAMLTAAADLKVLQAHALQALADPRVAEPAQLPFTGLTPERERQLSAAFIRVAGDDPALAVYGTRCSTVIVVQQNGTGRSVYALERSFGADGRAEADVRHTWDLVAG